MIISDDGKRAVESAIAKAEQGTSGEIVAVIANASGDYYYVPYMWAALLALIVPWPLIYLTWMPVQDIYVLQLAVFAAFAIALHYPPLRFALVPKAVMRRRAHQRAVEQFVAQDIYTTAGHTGVLLFVSVAERYAEIVVDQAIHAKVPDNEWQDIIASLTATIGRGDPVAGLIAAIGRIGEHLAAHFPPTPDKQNLLPNHLVILGTD
jgi:putative membrane protein